MTFLPLTHLWDLFRDLDLPESPRQDSGRSEWWQAGTFFKTLSSLDAEGGRCSWGQGALRLHWFCFCFNGRCCQLYDYFGFGFALMAEVLLNDAPH